MPSQPSRNRKRDRSSKTTTIFGRSVSLLPASNQFTHTQGPLESDERYPVGSRQWIMHKEGFPCQAEIIEIRHREVQQKTTGAVLKASLPGQVKSSSSSSLSIRKHKQYYVHFVNFDKRLDEWVEEDRIVTRDEMRRSLSNLESGQTTERTLQRDLRRRLGSRVHRGGTVPRHPPSHPRVHTIVPLRSSIQPCSNWNGNTIWSPR